MPSTTDDIKEAADALGKLISLDIKTGDYPAAGKTVLIDEVPHIFVPGNCSLQKMESALAAPRRIRVNVKVIDLESFLSYLNTYKEPSTQIFVRSNADGLNATAIIDYPASAAQTAWGQHRITFFTQHTPEWQRWMGLNKEALSQRVFGEFVENNLQHFVNPSGADMLTIARDIEVKQNVEWKGTVRLENGDTSINYINTSKAGAGEIEVPNRFTIGLRVFRGGVVYPLDAKLRVKLSGSELALQYELLRVEELLEAVMTDIIGQINTRTEIMPLVGEAPTLA